MIIPDINLLVYAYDILTRRPGRHVFKHPVPHQSTIHRNRSKSVRNLEAIGIKLSSKYFQVGPWPVRITGRGKN